MTIKKYIDSCIDQLREMLGDPNNELTSEQQSKIEKHIRDLKRLRRAPKLSHREIFPVANQIAETLFEIAMFGSSE